MFVVRVLAISLSMIDSTVIGFQRVSSLSAFTLVTVEQGRTAYRQWFCRFMINTCYNTDML